MRCKQVGRWRSRGEEAEGMRAGGGGPPGCQCDAGPGGVERSRCRGPRCPFCAFRGAGPSFARAGRIRGRPGGRHVRGAFRRVAGGAGLAAALVVRPPAAIPDTCSVSTCDLPPLTGGSPLLPATAARRASTRGGAGDHASMLGFRSPAPNKQHGKGREAETEMATGAGHQFRHPV